MNESTKTEIVPAEVTKDVMIPDGFPYEVHEAIQKALKAKPQRAIAFQNEKQRNATFIRKGLTKPGKISYDTLRRSANSVHVVRICINVLKEKITKTKWVVQPIDQLKRKKAGDDSRIEEITEILKSPNTNGETFRTLLDKILEDLLVLDSVSIEKTRYPDGKLAELYFVDSASIRPVFDEFGNMDVPIPLKTKDKGTIELPASYVQVLDNSQYGGPESGEIIAAWPKRDFIYFHMHPQGSMDGFGYGLSPIEGVLSVVANLLNADNYNSTYFEEGSFPPIILQVVGQMNQRDLEAFREYMIQELTGNFHRPAIMAGKEKAEVLDLKGMSNRDMEFMEYFIILAKLLCAAYGLSPQDIGLTDDVNRATADVMKDLSEGKGYGSILALLKEVINREILWSDFGYKDLEFEWVSPDSTEPDIASGIYDKALRNGTLTLNEVRQKIGETPYGEWADKPMLLGTEGYTPVIAQPDPEEEAEDAAVESGEKPYDASEAEDMEKSMRKAVYTAGSYKCWADDRGYSQPFIFQDILSGEGMCIKPPVAVNLQSQELEIETSSELALMGLNVVPVEKMTYVQIIELLRDRPEVFIEFEKYCDMDAEYDSEKWRAKHGGSRKFAYYLVSKYVDGYSLNNPLLIADMKRDPDSYKMVPFDLAKMWKVEKDLLLGDRRADQYIITNDKRAWGIDYQFRGDFKRWESNSEAIPNVLKNIPELMKIFETERKKKPGVVKQIIKRLGRVYNKNK